MKSFEDRHKKILKKVGYYNIKKKVKEEKDREAVDKFYRSLYGINTNGVK